MLVFCQINFFLTDVLQNETEIELGSLLRQDYQGLHNELLLRIGEHYQQVFNGLSILASFASNDDPYQGPKDITSPELMVSDGAIVSFGFYTGKTDVLYYIMIFNRNSV